MYRTALGEKVEWKVSLPASPPPTTMQVLDIRGAGMKKWVADRWEVLQVVFMSPGRIRVFTISHAPILYILALFTGSRQRLVNLLSAHRYRCTSTPIA